MKFHFLLFGWPGIAAALAIAHAESDPGGEEMGGCEKGTWDREAWKGAVAAASLV